MSAPILARQAITLCRIVADHVAHDPVVFGIQVFRRLPAGASRAAGAVLSVVPGTAAAAAASWLTGDVSRAREYVTARPAGRFQSRVLGELALSMGDRHTAIERAADVVGVRGGQLLEARIRWHEGRMSDAVASAPPSRTKDRLAAELRVFQPDWEPKTSAAGAAPTPRDLPTASVLFSLTNSLPHTQSGYTLRTHAVLTAVKDAGVPVVGADRTGYPTDIGRPVLQDRVQIDGIDYLFDIPRRLGNTLDERLEQHASFLARTARDSRAQALHTTTHFTNGLAARAAARELGLPWVYEVRGSLEDTWASSRGDENDELAARRSERFRLFRQRETDVARSADAVITLGRTMADELADRGVDRSRILVAPNSVSEGLLSADWREDPASVRESLGLPRRGVWVGTAASIVGYEGLDVLVDAVAHARGSGIDLRMLIVGDGVELPAVKERAAKLEDAAVFTGRVPPERAQQYVLALDTFVVPRKDVDVCRKITPLKPVEAGGLGRAVVLSDLPALTEALPEGTRTVFAAEQVDELTRVLVALAEDPDERQRLGSAARLFVEENRTWAALGERYRRMYEGLGVRVKGGHV